VDKSSLIEAVRRHLPRGASPDPVRLRAALEERLPDPRRRRGVRHPWVPQLGVRLVVEKCVVTCGNAKKPSDGACH